MFPAPYDFSYKDKKYRKSTVFRYQSHSVRTYSFLTAGKSETLGGSGLDGNTVLIRSHDLGKTFTHRRYMRIHLRTLGTYRTIYITHGVTFGCYETDCLAEQYLAVYIESILRCVGKMVADVTHIGRTQQGIAHGMYQHIGIAVSEQAVSMVNLYTAHPEFAALYELVHIETETYSVTVHNHIVYRQQANFITIKITLPLFISDMIITQRLHGCHTEVK